MDPSIQQALDTHLVDPMPSNHSSTANETVANDHEKGTLSALNDLQVNRCSPIPILWPFVIFYVLRLRWFLVYRHSYCGSNTEFPYCGSVNKILLIEFPSLVKAFQLIIIDGRVANHSKYS